MRSSLSLLGAWFVSVCLISACVENDGREPELPPELRIGVVPDERPETLHERYDPLIEYLEDRLKIPCTLIIPDSYGALLTQFHERRVDLAYFGGHTFVQAMLKDQAVPLVMRPVDTRFTSLFIVGGQSEVQSLDGLKDMVFSFGSELSTSGHLMPRYFLSQDGIDPETFFKAVRYSGAHDNTVFQVRDGIVDAGVANAAIVRSMQRNGLLADDDIRVLQETPPYSDYVWAIHPDVGAQTAQAVRAAFLLLTPENEHHRPILAGIDATGYLPANPEEFNRLEQIVRELSKHSPSGSAR